MLGCPACFRRLIRSIGLPQRQSAYLFQNSVRRYQATSTLSQDTTSAQETRPPHRDAWKDSSTAWNQKDDQHKALRAKPPEETKEMRDLKSELKYLRDPAKLADHVQYVLSKNDFDKAIALVRLSSRSMLNVVSWNHLIDYQMKDGKTKAALETYNEMKKRAIRPDSYTYLIILRGLGNFAHYPGSLGRALSIYHAMNGPKANVAPTIMHTNAILKVCARANDMDSLWDIASRLPEKGPHAANNWTFTTIINNLRMNAITQISPGEEPEAAARRRESAIVEGRRLWSLIQQRWRLGDLLVDEELVCSMGRLLLVGDRPRDWDDVLSLLHQTMDIPRLIPRLGSASRSNLPKPKPTTPLITEEEPPTTSNEFDPITGQDSPRTGSPPLKVSSRRRENYVYARPGNSTLSLVSEACLKMMAKKPAQDYWSLLTDPSSYALVPDLDNYHALLRILRASRSSSEALALLNSDLPSHSLRPNRKTFRIAFSAASRDARNPHILETATSLLSLLQEHLSDPEPNCLTQYLDIALSASEARASSASSASSAVERVEQSKTAVRILIRALELLEPQMRNVRSLVAFGSAEPGRRGVEAQARMKSAVGMLMRKMISVYDKVLAVGRAGAQQDEEDAAAREQGIYDGPALVRRVGKAAMPGSVGDGGLEGESRRRMLEARNRLQAYVTREAASGEAAGRRRYLAEQKKVGHLRDLSEIDAEMEKREDYSLL